MGTTFIYDFTTQKEAGRFAAEFSRLGYSASEPRESHDHLWCVTVCNPTERTARYRTLDMINAKTHRTAKRHNVIIYMTAGSPQVRCHKCGQEWAPMLQAGGKLPRQWWKCPRGWECN